MIDALCELESIVEDLKKKMELLDDLREAVSVLDLNQVQILKSAKKIATTKAEIEDQAKKMFERRKKQSEYMRKWHARKKAEKQNESVPQPQ